MRDNKKVQIKHEMVADCDLNMSLRAEIAHTTVLVFTLNLPIAKHIFNKWFKGEAFMIVVSNNCNSSFALP